MSPPWALTAGLISSSSIRRTASAGESPSTGDGVALGVDDEALVKDQTAAAENGLYVVRSGAWIRRADADINSELGPGTSVLVAEGTVNGDLPFMLTTDAPITIGTTPLVFEPFPPAIPLDILATQVFS